MSDTADVRPRSNDSETVRILMADPDDSLQPFYGETLTNEGFDVVTAFTGLECVARLRERAPDLLVLEPQLPWGGGDGILALMAELPELASIRVLVHTSGEDSQVLSQVGTFPVSGYYPKLLPPDQLAATLRNLLKHPGQGLTLADQVRRLESAIARRTQGRVRALQVEFVGKRVIVHGHADSHYVKQLALAALRDEFEASEIHFTIELDIEISGMAIPGNAGTSNESSDVQVESPQPFLKEN